MAALKCMAAEYRQASARLAMRIQEKRAAGASEAELRPLSQALEELRAVQRALDGYYTVPRPEGLCAVGWTARRTDDNA